MSQPRLLKRRFGWAIWLLVLGGAAAAAWFLLARHPAEPLLVRAHAVERGTVRDRVTSVAAGRISGKREVTIRAELAGAVLKVHHRRGERVEAGQALITFDVADLKDRLRVARASSALAHAQMLQTEASARIAKRSAAREKHLADTGVVPPAAAETLEGHQEVAEKAAGASRAGLAQSWASVEVAEHALKRSVVYAAFSGTVLSTVIEEGEVSTPGSVLLTLADVSTLHVDADLDEADLGKVALGMPAEVTLDAFPSERFTGSLSEIAPSVTRDARGNRSIAMRIDLAPDKRHRVGMSADVDVIVATRDAALHIPPSAVVGRGLERAAFVVEAGVARRRALTIGIATWETVEVLDGLSEGESVILTTSSNSLSDGLPVRVEPQPEPPTRVAR